MRAAAAERWGAVAAALGALGAAQWAWLARLQNAAFVDEATYIVAGRLQHDARPGTALPAFATYFSGAPGLYPPVAAWAERIGGLEGARTVSVVLVWAATLAVFAVGARLFDDLATGVLGAAVFAVQAPVVFLARLATVDAPSLAMLAVALAVALGGRTQRARLVHALVAGAALGVAVGFKYAALLYWPSMAVIAALNGAGGARSAIERAAALVIGAGLVLWLVVAVGGSELITGFATTTFARTAPSGGSGVDILRFAATLGGALTVLALPAVLLRAPVSVPARLTLVVTALLAPLNHARLHEFTSLHKHVAFGALFLAPLAGWTLRSAVDALVARWRRRHTVLAATSGAALLLALYRVMIFPAVEESERLYAYAPQSAAAARLALRPLVTRSAHFLDEEPDLGAFYLPATEYTQWSHPYDFAFRTADGRALRGRDAHVAAVREGYFNAIVLRYGPQRDWARAIEAELLAAQPRYRLARRLPFTLADGPGEFELWVRSDVPGARDVR